MGVSTLPGLGQVAVPLIRPLLRTSVWMVFGDRELAGARCSFQGLPINLSLLVQLGHEAKSEAPFGPSRLVPMMTMCLVGFILPWRCWPPDSFLESTVGG